MIIDSHVHVVVGNPAYRRNLDVEELVAKLDAAGVAKAVIVQSRSGNGLDNAYPAECAARFAKRFVVVCAVDALSPGAADLMRKRVHEWNSRGCRLFVDEWDPVEPRFDPLWECAADLDMPILLAGKVPLRGVGKVLSRFPALNLVLDHVGNVELKRGLPGELLELAVHPNLVVKFSSHNIEDCRVADLSAQAFVSQLVSCFGAGRLLWGSNYPASHEPEWPYDGCVDAARRLLAPLPASDRESVLCNTAMRLWPELG